MKKMIFSFTYVVILFLCLGCSKGSSGTAMLNLGEIRVVPDPDQLDNPDTGPFVEKLATVFTVLPGPYEFVWEELKNQDGSIGYEQCSTKLKLKLKLNKKLQFIPNKLDAETHKFLSGEDVVPWSFRLLYKFRFLDAEGKGFGESDGYILDTDLENIWGADGRIGYKENNDGLLDFYRFLTGESGTEYELVIDCQIHLCSDIKKIIESNKSMIVMASYGGAFRSWKVVDL